MLSVYGGARGDCCGCAACADKCPAGAITMLADDEGFLYPVIAQSACTDCGVCAAICPLRRAGHYKEPQAPRFFVMKHRSEETLRRSTSGGAFTALSDVILRAGGTVYGADFDDALRVLHRRAQTAPQRDRMRFSKYVQSTQEGIYPLIRADLEAGRTRSASPSPVQSPQSVRRSGRITMRMAWARRSSISRRLSGGTCQPCAQSYHPTNKSRAKKWRGSYWLGAGHPPI